METKKLRILALISGVLANTNCKTNDSRELNSEVTILKCRVQLMKTNVRNTATNITKMKWNSD